MRAKAIVLPSGDQAGMRPSAPATARRCVPSARTMVIGPVSASALSAVKTICEPSGLQSPR